MTTEVGFSQLMMGSPAALPTGTRPDAIPPTTVPSAKGVRIDDSAKRFSIGC
jgi:cobalamin biosynthesis Mg chelatase CobN